MSEKHSVFSIAFVYFVIVLRKFFMISADSARVMFRVGRMVLSS